jgi:hypothetical protein
MVDDESLPAVQFVPVKVTSALAYDLCGQAESQTHPRNS